MGRGVHNPVLRTFHSGSFSFHPIPPAPRAFGIARDSSHLNASNLILSAADSSNPTATISFRKWTEFRSSQAMGSSPGRGGSGSGCMRKDVAEIILQVPSVVWKLFNLAPFWTDVYRSRKNGAGPPQIQAQQGVWPRWTDVDRQFGDTPAIHIFHSLCLIILFYICI